MEERPKPDIFNRWERHDRTRHWPNTSGACAVPQLGPPRDSQSQTCFSACVMPPLGFSLFRVRACTSTYPSQPGCFSSDRSERLLHCCMELLILTLHNLETSSSANWWPRLSASLRIRRSEHTPALQGPWPWPRQSRFCKSPTAYILGPVQVHRLGYVFVLTPVLTGSVILLAVAVVVNNLSKHSERHYPTMWW
jgi:hypothetical protein